MQASILDLRYRMNDVLKALDRNERVSILYHGKLKGEIIPIKHEQLILAEQHPLFGMRSQEDDVENIMNDLRSERYRDL